MTTTRKQPAAASTITVEALRRETVEIAILGTTPLILHKMSHKALEQLLLPSGPKTRAERQSTLKHVPREEFRAAADTLPSGPTHLAISATAFKAAMMTAALDTSGMQKTQVGRLVFVHEQKIPIYGKPFLYMAVTRNSDKARTPDVRSRPILPEWATLLRITYAVPLLTEKTIVNLLTTAGITAGVGDWRQEKGSGNYGTFVPVSPDDPMWRAVMQVGREQQIAAMEAAEPYDETSAELLAFFDDEAARRGRVPKVGHPLDWEPTVAAEVVA